MLFVWTTMTLGFILFLLPSYNKSIAMKTEPDLLNILNELDNFEKEHEGWLIMTPIDDSSQSFIDAFIEKIPTTKTFGINLTEKKIPEIFQARTKKAEQALHKVLVWIKDFIIRHLDIWSPANLDWKKIILTIPIVVLILILFPRLSNSKE